MKTQLTPGHPFRTSAWRHLGLAFNLVVAGLMSAAAAPENTSHGLNGGAANPGFQQCKAALRELAQKQGVSEQTLATVLDRARFIRRVIELDQKQPEFTRSFSDYYKARVTDARVAQGRTLLTRHWALLQRVQRQTGVPAHYLVAFWGLETNFGSYTGKMSVPDSLTTLACDPRRKGYFTGELLAALSIIDAGDITAGRMQGSWAGAMGQVQFMPSAFLRYAVDADGDGNRDLWHSIPDAMFSAGNFLQHLGWQRGLRWGREVLLPADFDYALANTGRKRPLHEWRAMGITDSSRRPLPALALPAQLLVPSGHKGPAFIAYQNFDVIMGWNRSEFYALTVGRLADRIAGAGRLASPLPENELTLTRGLVGQLQADLNTLGYNVGEPDGIPGPLTRTGISRFQQATGRVADGYLEQAILDTIRVAAKAKSASAKTAVRKPRQQ